MRTVGSLLVALVRNVRLAACRAYVPQAQPGRRKEDMQRSLGGSSISAVRIKRQTYPVLLGGVSADQRGCVVRGGVEPPTFRFSGGRSYRLSYLTLARCSAEAPTAAVLTGFEPATSTLTGWRALQLLYRTLLVEAFLPRSQEHITDTAVVAAPPKALLEGRASCPQRDSNPCRRLERAVS